MNSKEKKMNSDPSSSKKAKLLKPGKHGTNGEIVELECNFFDINLMPGFQVFQYYVEFIPLIKNSNDKRLLLNQHSNGISDHILDRNTVYTTNELKVLKFISFLDKLEVKIKFTEVKMTWPSFHFLNLIFQQAISFLDLQMIGGNFYDPSAVINIPTGELELWPGYIVLIQEFERDVLLCCELSYKVIRSQTIRSVMCSIFRSNNRNWKEMFKKEMINKTVVTSYDSQVYIIHDIDFKKNPTSTYERKSKISHVEHFRKTHKIKISDVQQPLLVSKSLKTNEIVYLIPELCRATGLVKKLVENQDLIDYVQNITDLKPDLRTKKILALNQGINNNPKSSQTLTKWKLELNKELKTIKGRVMPRQLIKFGNLQQFEVDVNGSWIKETKYSQFYKAVPLREWYIICFSTHLIDVEKFVKELNTASKCINYELLYPIILTVEKEKISSFTEKIQFIDENYEPQLILIVLPNKIVFSDEIEMMCLNKRSIPVHIELLKTIQSSDRKFAKKILTKMNCKVGGIPWSVMITEEKVMTIGLHIWRDSVDGTLYHGAFVASMDLRKNAEYYSSIFNHKNADTLSYNLNINFTKALEDFRTLNLVLPQTIIFYRIKSGTYNLEFAKKTEISPLVSAIKELYGVIKNFPKFSYIMVNKANNTRLFDNDVIYENPLPGTIVDDFITFSDRHDFYLISQHSEQGSTTTTYYNVIYNSGLTTDFIQLWTWKMTHLFYNCTGTINCPAVCEYAQKLAKFSSKFMRNTAANGMKNKLYYL